MGIDIGTVHIPFVETFDVEDTDRKVDALTHIDVSVPTIAEFPEDVPKFVLVGTLMATTVPLKTLQEAVDDALSLLDKSASQNSISFDGDVGWLAIGDVDIPRDVDELVTRKVTITGYFLSNTKYSL